MVLERKHEPLLSSLDFLRRFARFGLLSVAVVVASLGIGMIGYHSFERLSWVDSFLNAAMILGGMGPVSVMQTEAGKIFAGFYALFGGIVFLVASGLLLTPWLHRLLHHFHLEEEGN